jgi:membrane protein
LAHSRSDERGRGRHADSPGQIPRAGWRDILLRTWEQMGEDHVSMVAAGVAFYGLLALFPAITAVISIWGLMFDPQTILQQVEQVSGILPEEARAVVADQATTIAAGAGAGVSLAAIGGILLALYSAMKGVKSLIEGLNIIYDEEEKRGFIKLNLLALVLTLALVFIMIGTLGLLVVYPVVVDAFGFSSIVQALVSLARWPLLGLVAVVGMAILYRYGPSRDRPKWRWVSGGAVAATLLWIVASIAFSIYMQYFGNYNETYGTLGAAIALLTWFWISAFVLLMGAELDSEIEHQTARDTTVGESRPMGQRGAHVADTLGERR